MNKQTTTIKSIKKTSHKPKKIASKTRAKAQRAATTRTRKQANNTGLARLFRWTRVHTVAATFILTAVILSGGFLYSQKELAASSGGQITGISSKCLDNNGNKAVANNKIQVWACTSTTRWTWTGDGTIRTSGWCLSVKGGAKTAGTLAVLNKCTTAAGQKWALKANNAIVDVNSGLCLDDKGSGTANGNTVWLYTCNASKAQQWVIAKAVVPLAVPAPAAHSALSTTARHTPKPVITLDTAAAPEFAPWLAQVKTLIEQWYPTLGDYYTYPGYVPTNTFTIKVDPTYAGVAMVQGTTITLSSDYFRTHLSDVGAIVHESVHIVQSRTAGGANLPSWIVEGEADFAREHIYNDRPARAAAATETYLNGYSPAANLLYYVQTKYAPTFVNSINTAGWNGTYTDDMFKQATGSTIAQLWTAMTGQPITNADKLTNGTSGKCLDIPNYVTTNKTRIQVQTCNGAPAEKWLFAGINKSTTTGVIKGYYGNKCLATDATKTDGTAVWYFDCTYGADQTWTIRADGTLFNANSGKCLQTVGQKDTDGTLLELSTCGTATAQRWTLPPF